MAINSKHLATFILGAAAGVAMHKYLQTEEGEKLVEDLKTKGNQLKSDAESALDKAPEYFETLKKEGSKSLTDILGTLKEKMPEAEKLITDLLNGSASDSQTIEVEES